MSSSAVASTSLPQLTTASRRSLAPLILSTLAFGWLWFIYCHHLSAEWSYNEQYSYGWFVPFFALYLLWLRWEDRPEPAGPSASEISGQRSAVSSDNRNRRARIATLISVPLLLLLFPLRLIEAANPDWRLISWVHALAAVTLTLLFIWWVGGRPWLRHFAFPVLFVLVSVPWLSGVEAPIIQGLMPIVAGIATETLALFGVPAEVQGNLIRISTGVVGVNEACSGVRSLQTSLMIGLLFGELKRLSTGRRIGLVIAAIAIAFVANCGRAFLLVWVAATRGVPQVDHWHDFAGYSIVVLVFFGCLGLTALLAREGKGEDPKPAPAPRASSIPFYFLNTTGYFAAALAFLLCIELGVETWYRSHEGNLQPSAQWSVRWPKSASQYREARIDERTKSILHHDEGKGAMWFVTEHNGGLTRAATSLLYFFRWYPGHSSALLANAHRPDVCLPASGWRQTGDFGVRHYEVAPGLTIPFRHFEFTDDAPGRTRSAHAFYCVWEDRVPKGEAGAPASGNSTEPSNWSRSERMGAVLDGRRHLGQQVMEYLLIQSQQISAAEAEDAFAAQVPELIAPAGKSL